MSLIYVKTFTLRVQSATNITELAIASTCHMVAPLCFFNPKFTLACLIFVNNSSKFLPLNGVL